MTASARIEVVAIPPSGDRRRLRDRQRLRRALVAAASIAVCGVPGGTLPAAVRPARPLDQAPGPVSPARAEQDDCRGCHAIAGHPIGVAANPTIGLPLGRAHTIDCSTCHAVAPGHGDAPQPAGETRAPIATGNPQRRSAAARGATAQLRLPARELCAACHRGESTPATFHALALQRAHLPLPAAADDSNRVDAETRLCLGCHDGSAASSVISAGGWADTGHQRGHASGASYRTAATRSELHLRREPALPQTVPLVDGRIGCGTCHSAYSRQPKLLNLPLRGSLLCRACHDL